jgi:Protein of unknown function (DUF1566)
MRNTLFPTMPVRKPYFMQFKHLCAALWCAASLGALADAPFTVSADGLEVTDAKTGLIWRRCAEGMIASVSGCTGLATLHNHVAALSLANSQAGWRLPNVQELMSIADRGRQNPSIDGVAFPATPTTYEFWSSSPVVGNAPYAWLVYFYDGVVYGSYRDNASYVRLVRAGQ